MKLHVLSLDEPYATLITIGKKRYETRSGPPTGDMRPDGVKPGLGGHSINRGDRIGIASTRRKPTPTGMWDPSVAGGMIGRSRLTYHDRVEEEFTWKAHGSDELRTLTLGALLCTATVVDCLPMVEPLDEALPCVEINDAGLHRWHPADPAPSGEADYVDISDQLPFGFWEPGRWAIELAEVEPTTKMCPWCRGYRGDPDVEGDRYFGVVEPGSIPPCPVCNGDGACPPVPVTGRQGVWAWDGTVRT